MRYKYFNLSNPIQIKEFEEFKKPMGWIRLNKENIKLKSKDLTKEEIKKLKEVLK